MTLALDPELEVNPRQCNDGGGRRGRTVLQAIADLRGDEPILHLDDRAWQDLADAAGHKSPSVTREEIRQMVARKTVGVFTKEFFNTDGKRSEVWTGVGITTKGRLLLEQSR